MADVKTNEQAKKPQLNLHFTANRMRLIEEELNNSIFRALEEISFTTVLVLVKHGLGLTTDEEAGKVMDDFFKKGGNLQDIIMQLVKALQDDGFFPKNSQTEALMAQLTQA